MKVPDLAPQDLSTLRLCAERPLNPDKGVKAAREFEANLIASLLNGFQRSFVGNQGEQDLSGSDDYKYLATQALAERIAAAGGFGIAAAIVRHLPPESKPR